MPDVILKHPVRSENEMFANADEATLIKFNFDPETPVAEVIKLHHNQYFLFKEPVANLTSLPMHIDCSWQ